MLELARTLLFLAAAAGCFIYAFVAGNPTWIGTGGALLGGEALARAARGGAGK